MPRTPPRRIRPLMACALATSSAFSTGEDPLGGIFCHKKIREADAYHRDQLHYAHPENFLEFFFGKAPDTFNFLRHVMRAILSCRPNCSHRCVSLKETALKPVQILKSTTKNSAEQTSMRAKCFKHIAI